MRTNPGPECFDIEILRTRTDEKEYLANASANRPCVDCCRFARCGGGVVGAFASVPGSRWELRTDRPPANTRAGHEVS